MTEGAVVEKGRTRMLDGELVESRQIMPGGWLQTYHAPALVAGARPGQFVHLRLPQDAGFVLRRPFSFHTIDRVAGRFSIMFTVAGRGTAWLARLRTGETVDILGPLGRGFELDSRSHHLLLVGAGATVAPLRALVDDALDAGRQVALLLESRDAASVYPSSLLPDEVEYVVATADGSLGHHGTVVDLVHDYEAWADQAFAAGPATLLRGLARLAEGRDARLGVARLGSRRGARAAPATGSPQARRRAWLQVALRQTMGCAVGACLGCVVFGSEGPLRVCREGPVFAADEIAWDEVA